MMMITVAVVLLCCEMGICALLLQADVIVQVLWCILHVDCEFLLLIRRARLR